METIMSTFISRASIAVAVLLAAGASNAQQVQTVEVPVSNPGEAVTLEISIQSAKIEVIGEDREDAVFQVTVGESQRKILTPSGAQVIKNAGYAFEIEEDDNTIAMSTDWRTGNMVVTVRVPRRTSVELHTIQDGELRISNLVGDQQLFNVQGPITASNISGSIIAESINDQIDVSFASIDEVNVSSMESINGDIVVGLAENAAATFQLDTAQGEMTSDFEVETETSERVVERDDDDNKVTVRIENALVAKVNGGGAMIRMKSLNGDLHIRKQN